MQSRLLRSDTTLLIGLSSILVILHVAVGNGYGFHRDELQFLDSSRHVAWGYVAYPPLTAIMGRLSIALFGISVQAYRLPAMLAAMLSLVLTGLIARELGGHRSAQLIAFFLALGSQVILASLMLYVVWDFLAWTLVCFFLSRVLRTGNGRWWIAVGASVGFGILSKYSIAFLVASILAGLILLPSQRQHLRKPWLYVGILVAVAIATPNLNWELRHDWVTLKMLSTIHARDVQLGRQHGFFLDQLKFTMLGSLVGMIGLVTLLRSQQYRLLAIFYIGPLLLFAICKGRGYYLIPAYTPLYAAGALWIERRIAHCPFLVRRFTVGSFIVLGLAGATTISIMMLPISHPGTPLFAFQMRTSSDMRDETGWPELVDQVALVRDTLPPEQSKHLGVFAGNYGEAGALALYGPAHGLPQPISVVNSFYYRSFPAPPLLTLIVIGEAPKDVAPLFSSCAIATYLTTQHHQSRSDNEDGPVLVCQNPTFAWTQFWSTHQRFG